MTLDPKLEKRSRRIHTTEYKLNILAQADACVRGELGVLLRREKLYSGQLKQWCEEFAEGGIVPSLDWKPENPTRSGPGIVQNHPPTRVVCI